MIEYLWTGAQVACRVKTLGWRTDWLAVMVSEK